jgi:hypothetical protein
MLQPIETTMLDLVLSLLFLGGQGRILYNFLGISGVFHQEDFLAQVANALHLVQLGQGEAAAGLDVNGFVEQWVYTSDDVYAANIF